MVNVEASTVEALVKFCYSGKINISDTNVLSILHTARTLQLHQVEELCCEFLKERLEPSSPLVMRAVTDSNTFPEAPLCADENVLHDFENIVNTEKSHKLLVDQLIELISSGELNVQLMEQVAVAVLQWIKSDLSARKPFLSQVMEQVGLCSSEFGKDNTATEGLLAKADAACGDLSHKTKARRLP
ncbi:BTB And Kelch [Cooperia oncophora]